MYHFDNTRQRRLWWYCSLFLYRSHPWAEASGPAQEAYFLVPRGLIAFGMGLKISIVLGRQSGVTYVQEPIMLRNALETVVFL